MSSRKQIAFSRARAFDKCKNAGLRRELPTELFTRDKHTYTRNKFQSFRTFKPFESLSEMKSEAQKA